MASEKPEVNWSQFLWAHICTSLSVISSLFTFFTWYLLLLGFICIFYGCSETSEPCVRTLHGFLDNFLWGGSWRGLGQSGMARFLHCSWSNRSKPGCYKNYYKTMVEDFLVLTIYPAELLHHPSLLPDRSPFYVTVLQKPSKHKLFFLLLICYSHHTNWSGEITGLCVCFITRRSQNRVRQNSSALMWIELCYDGRRALHGLSFDGFLKMLLNFTYCSWLYRSLQISIIPVGCYCS